MVSASPVKQARDSRPAPGKAHLELVSCKWRVRRAESQDIDETARGPRPHSLVFVCE